MKARPSSNPYAAPEAVTARGLGARRFRPWSLALGLTLVALGLFGLQANGVLYLDFGLRRGLGWHYLPDFLGMAGFSLASLVGGLVIASRSVYGVTIPPGEADEGVENQE